MPGKDIEPYKFMIYQKDGKSVVHVGDAVYKVDELVVNVPTYAEYDVEGVAQFVMSGVGRTRMQTLMSGEIVAHTKCVITES